MTEPDDLLGMLVETMKAARLIYLGGDEEGARELAFSRCIPMVVAYVSDCDPADFQVYEVLNEPVFPVREVKA